jgi:hypothetical protein
MTSLSQIFRVEIGKDAIESRRRRQAGDLAACLDSMVAAPGVVLLRVKSTLSAAADAAAHAGFRVCSPPTTRCNEKWE